MSVAAHALRRGFDWPDEAGYQPASTNGARLQLLWAEERNFLRGSANDWWPVVAPALMRIRAECRAAGWDGAGSVAVSIKALQQATGVAECLADLVPVGTPPPDIVPEADGEISFSWHGDANRVFAISVGAHDKINFAWQFAEEGSVHGWQPVRFDSRKSLHESLAEIARHIGRLAANSAASRRA